MISVNSPAAPSAKTMQKTVIMAIYQAAAIPYAQQAVQAGTDGRLSHLGNG